MPLTSEFRAFVDADVLASPVSRTVLYLMRPLSSFELVYSRHVEAEALRHQKPGHIPVDTLRGRFDWPLVEDPGNPAAMDDTDPKDRPVLAAAVAAGAGFVITRNVRDFGPGDLARHGVSAVHPGVFLAHHSTAESYREVLESIGEHRAREPRSAPAIHATEIALHLPALFDAYRNLFGLVRPGHPHQPPAIPFRGPRCVKCARITHPEPTGLCCRCSTL
ncbi:MAG: hypothetical protein LBG11_04710 [Bifidobacteriaceae bacterium]|nr:hypothetical protein [Bifidobacteriaceae bacterium]